MFLTLLLLLARPALAENPAEYVRLSTEMERLAAKGTWDGVERSYLRMQELGMQPRYEEHYLGAQAARAAGDVGAARARLQAALGERSEDDARTWLTEIDRNYGPVELISLPGAHALVAAEVPFEAGAARAVEFAQHKLATDGRFVGLLPNGAYRFGTYDVDVIPRIQARRLDLTEEARAAAAAPMERPASQSRGGVSVLLGFPQIYQLGGGLVVRDSVEAPRYALFATGGVDPSSGKPTFNGGARKYLGTRGVFADVQFGGLVWPAPNSTDDPLDGISLGLGLESAGMGLDFMNGMMSLDGGFGVGACFLCMYKDRDISPNNQLIAARAGLSLSMQLGPR